MDKEAVSPLETISDREAELILTIIGAAKTFWDDRIPPWLVGTDYGIEDIEKLSSKLLEFRMRIRAYERNEKN